MSRLQTSFVLGYHGCERELGLAAVNGKLELLKSKGDFDWLGAGIYFWENDPVRAGEWAQQKASRGDYTHPFVIGAVIDLGNCLDLLVRENVELVRSAHASFVEVRKKANLPLPTNKPAPKDASPDLVMRFLDCAVMNHFQGIISQQDKIEPFDSVRALFGEGEPLYEGSGFKHKTHSQLAVLNPSCIKGLFLPR